MPQPAVPDQSESHCNGIWIAIPTTIPFFKVVIPFFIFSSVFTGFLSLPLGAGLHCVADIDMYSEFFITMIIPAVGLLLIFLLYRGWLWRIQRSSISTSIADGSTDAERGALHGLEPDSDAMASQGARDHCAWLAIGWLFMVNPVPSQIKRLRSIFSHSLLSTRSTPSSAERLSNLSPAGTSTRTSRFIRTSTPRAKPSNAVCISD
jgi:hypothetical protein